ncbi:hypothetical protein SEVIR_9G415900v4 [Setaria viridis]
MCERCRNHPHGPRTHRSASGSSVTSTNSLRTPAAGFTSRSDRRPTRDEQKTLGVRDAYESDHGSRPASRPNLAGSSSFHGEFEMEAPTLSLHVSADPSQPAAVACGPVGGALPRHERPLLLSALPNFRWCHLLRSIPFLSTSDSQRSSFSVQSRKTRCYLIDQTRLIQTVSMLKSRADKRDGQHSSLQKGKFERPCFRFLQTWANPSV